MRLLHETRLFFIALQFFTRLPIPRWVGFEAAWLQQCARYFPLVGLVVGAFSAAVLWTALCLWPPAVAVGLSMAASCWLTGGFHEDGWADTCDGLGGAVSRDKALLIMKDSRLGSYGALGLVFMLGLKASALISLTALSLPLTLTMAVLAHMGSRLAPLVLMHTLSYAGDAEHAKAKPLATHIGGPGLWIGAAWVLLVSVAAAGLTAALWPALLDTLLRALAASLLAGALACVWMRRWFQQRLGGYTGDNLGATQQGVELAMLLAALAAAPLGAG